MITQKIINLLYVRDRTGLTVSMEVSKQMSSFRLSANEYIEAAKKVCQVLEGAEREQELDKLRALMEESCRDAREFELQVKALKEVDKRMDLPDLDIEQQYAASLEKLKATHEKGDPRFVNGRMSDLCENGESVS